MGWRWGGGGVEQVWRWGGGGVEVGWGGVEVATYSGFGIKE